MGVCPSGSAIAVTADAHVPHSASPVLTGTPQDPSALRCEKSVPSSGPGLGVPPVSNIWYAPGEVEPARMTGPRPAHPETTVTRLAEAARAAPSVVGVKLDASADHWLLPGSSGQAPSTCVPESASD